MRIKSFHIFLGICILEAVVYIICHYIVPDSISKWQLASRYSARFSVVLFFLIQTDVFLNGIPRAFEKSSLREKFIAFAFNHFIHLVFLVTNKIINKWDMNILGRIPEVLAYALIGIFLIVFIFSQHQSKISWYLFQITLFLTSAIIVITFVKRVFGEAQPWSDANAFIVLLFLSIIGFILNLIGTIKSNIKLQEEIN